MPDKKPIYDHSPLLQRLLERYLRQLKRRRLLRLLAAASVGALGLCAMALVVLWFLDSSPLIAAAFALIGFVAGFLQASRKTPAVNPLVAAQSADFHGEGQGALALYAEGSDQFPAPSQEQALDALRRALVEKRPLALGDSILQWGGMAFLFLLIGIFAFIKSPVNASDDSNDESPEISARRAEETPRSIPPSVNAAADALSDIRKRILEAKSEEERKSLEKKHLGAKSQGAEDARAALAAADKLEVAMEEGNPEEIAAAKQALEIALGGVGLESEAAALEQQLRDIKSDANNTLAMLAEERARLSAAKAAVAKAKKSGKAEGDLQAGEGNRKAGALESGPEREVRISAEGWRGVNARAKSGIRKGHGLLSRYRANIEGLSGR